jgi:predicted nucleotidyltransferase
MGRMGMYGQPTSQEIEIGKEESLKRKEFAQKAIPIMTGVLNEKGYQIEEIRVVGSVSKDMAGKESDLDLSVITNHQFMPQTQENMLRLMEFIFECVHAGYQASRELGQEYFIDTTVMFSDDPQQEIWEDWTDY